MMERRAAERFSIDFDAEVSACGRAGADVSVRRVKVRDISSAGALVHGGDSWVPGEPVQMAIHVGERLVGPFSYSLSARGWIVRIEPGETGEDSRFAVSFDKRIRMLDWREIEARANGRGGDRRARGEGI